MKVKPNIGIVNALVRITIGLTILSWSTARLARRPRRQSYLFMAMFGAMRVGEGILQYCPMTAFIQQAQKSGNGLPELKQLIDTFIPKQMGEKLEQGLGEGKDPANQGRRERNNSQQNGKERGHSSGQNNPEH